MWSRRSTRLPGFDYGQPGAYFVTICTEGGLCILGEEAQGSIRLSRIGELISRTWEELPTFFAQIHLDAFVAMPNHIHGLLLIEPVGAGLAPPIRASRGKGGASPAPTLIDAMRVFKSRSTIRANRVEGTNGRKLWQRGFYDHVIRRDEDLNRIREYIMGNPSRWVARLDTSIV